jgi:hypothetical protein
MYRLIKLQQFEKLSDEKSNYNNLSSFALCPKYSIIIIQTLKKLVNDPKSALQFPMLRDFDKNELLLILEA